MTDWVTREGGAEAFGLGDDRPLPFFLAGRRQRRRGRQRGRWDGWRCPVVAPRRREGAGQRLRNFAFKLGPAAIILPVGRIRLPYCGERQQAKVNNKDRTLHDALTHSHVFHLTEVR